MRELAEKNHGAAVLLIFLMSFSWTRIWKTRIGRTMSFFRASQLQNRFLKIKKNIRPCFDMKNDQRKGKPIVQLSRQLTCWLDLLLKETSFRLCNAILCVWLAKAMQAFQCRVGPSSCSVAMATLFVNFVDLRDSRYDALHLLIEPKLTTHPHFK